MKALLKTGLVMALVGVMGCTGGGGDDDDDVPGTPDAGVNLVDAAGATPDAFVCPVTAAITEMPIEGEAGNSAVLRTLQEDGVGDRLVWNFVVGGGTDFLQFGIDEPVTLGTALPLVMACTEAVAYCWILLGDFTNTAGMLDSDVILFPDTGTITITETGATGTGRFKATITSAMFNHYSGGMLVNDGCTTITPMYTVDLPITAPMTKPGAKIVPTELPALHISR